MKITIQPSRATLTFDLTVEGVRELADMWEKEPLKIINMRTSLYRPEFEVEIERNI